MEILGGWLNEVEGGLESGHYDVNENVLVKWRFDLEQ